MSKQDTTDLALLTLAASAVAAIIFLHRNLKPLPLHRRAAVQARKVVAR